jgi:hypothetical protein
MDSFQEALDLGVEPAVHENVLRQMESRAEDEDGDRH